MKTNMPNPLVPQGSLPNQRGKSHVRIAVFTILAIHGVLLGALLLQGCKRTTTSEDLAMSNVDTNYPPPPIDTSAAPPVVSVPPETVQTSTPPPIETQAVTQFTQTPTQNLVPPPLDELPPPVTPVPAPAPSSTEHVIVAGDVYSKIARQYNVTVRGLIEANPGVNPNRLKIGQKIVIPAPGTASAPAATVNGGSTSGQKTYVVKSGDNLMKIARTQGTTVKALRSANRLKTDRITVGQKLVIPGRGISDTGVGGTSGVPQTLPAP